MRIYISLRWVLKHKPINVPLHRYLNTHFESIFALIKFRTHKTNKKPWIEIWVTLLKIPHTQNHTNTYTSIQQALSIAVENINEHETNNGTEQKKQAKTKQKMYRNFLLCTEEYTTALCVRQNVMYKIYEIYI